MKSTIRPVVTEAWLLPWILLLLLCCPDSTSAQPGSIDPSFSPNFDGSKQVDSVAFQADGKILIARDILSRGTGLPLIIRLSTDGTLDPSFDSSSVPLKRIYSIKTAFDGQILVAGVFTNEFLTNGLGRLHVDGTLDSSFAPRLPFGDKLQSFATVPDGRVLVAGLAEEQEEEPKEDPPGILRLNLDGSLDATFRPGSAPNLGISGILPLEDGRALIWGQFTEIAGNIRCGLARLNADGSLDMTFLPPPAPSPNSHFPSIRAVAVQSDGKVLIGGAFARVGGLVRTGIARLNADGVVDPSFEAPLSAEIGSIAVQRNDKIVVGGNFQAVGSSARVGIARLNRDGSLDPAFVLPVERGTQILRAVAQPDDRMIVTTTRQPLVRLLSGELPDSPPAIAFQSKHQTRTVGQDLHLEVQVKSRLPPAYQWRFNGRILPDATNGTLSLANVRFETMGSYSVSVSTAVGSVESAPIHVVIHPAPIQPGSVDLGFGAGAGPNGAVNAIARQGDTLLIGGEFTTFDKVDRTRVARLQLDGSLDPSFDVGTGPNLRVLCLAVQPDGKVLLGGSFTRFNGAPRAAIARVNVDGSADAEFNQTARVVGELRSIVVQPDGRILAGGLYEEAGGIAYTNLVRLNSDGSFDPGFSMNSSLSGLVRSISLQPDGKILVGGHFYPTNEAMTSLLMRLHPNGVLDREFRPPFVDTKTGLYPAVNSVLRLNDGNLLVGGSFSVATSNTNVPTSIVRLDANGNLDPSYRFDHHQKDGWWFQGSFELCMQLAPDGRLYAGNLFRLFRLNGEGIIDSTFSTYLNGTFAALAVLENGDLVVGGNFHEVNRVPRNHLVRLNGIARLPLPELIGPFLSANGFQLAVATYSGRTYVLEISEDLDGKPWTPVATVVGSDQFTTLEDPITDRPNRFYRIRLQP